MHPHLLRKTIPVVAAAVAMGLFSATPASAAAVYGKCIGATTGPTLEISTHWQWKDASHQRMLVTHFNYRIYGPIRDKNNVELTLLKMSPTPKSELWERRLDEIPKTSTWRLVDIHPDIELPASYALRGRGKGVFDQFGIDPICDAWTPAF